MADKTVSPEIVKLMDKMTQNPASRLFVPLAEEYLKCDMVEEAIIVLAEGIKNHPNYVAARVMLGKIYLQKNQIPEAQNEFEQVIGANPENILAHKKLAVIYQGQGQSQRALEACQKILAIDPSDKEAKGLVGVLEKQVASEGASEKGMELSNPPVAAEIPVATETDKVEAASSPILPPESALHSDPAAPIEEVPIEVPLQMEPAPVESVPPVEENLNDPFKAPAEPVAPSIPEEFPAAVIDEAPESAPAAMVAPDPIGTEGSSAFDEDSWEGDKTVVAGFEIPSPPNELVPSASMPPSSDAKEEPLLSTTLASLYMSQGHYKEAAEMYEKLLERDPSDEESRQGLEKALRRLAPENKAESASNTSNPDDSKNKKTRRLQSWLDSIRKKE